MSALLISLVRCLVMTVQVDGVSNLLSTHRLDQVAATNGQVLAWDDGNDRWQPSAAGVALTSLSVSAPLNANGTGAIQYNNTTGEFTYTPPDLSGYALTAALADYVLVSAVDPLVSTITLDVVTGNNSTTANDISVGELTATSIVGHISISDLKTLVGAASTYADFQTAISAL